MFKGIPKQAFIITIVLVTLIYMASYMFVTYNQDVDFLRNATEFLNSLKHTFLAACAITSITAIILVFNSNVQSRQEKKKEIFTKKLALYSEIIEKMNKFFIRKNSETEFPIIDEEERLELFFLQLRVLLLSEPDTCLSFNEMKNNLTDEKNQIHKDSYLEVLNFIKKARKDLEVQEKMSKEEEENFNKTIIKEIESSTEKLVESFSNYNQNLGVNENKLFEKLHDSIDKLVSGKDNIESSFSDTGGCSINVIKTKQSASQKLLNIVPKKSFLELLILRDYKEKYYRPEIKGLLIENIRKYAPYYDNHSEEDLHPTYTIPWGYQFYKVKLNYDDIENYIKPIICLIENAYNTKKDEKVLSIKKQTHQKLEDVFNNSFKLKA